MAKTKGAGPTPSVGKLTGKSAKGRQGGAIKGSRGAIGTAPTDPSQAGNPDVVADRKNQAMQGTMLHKQLAKNKSTGLGAKKR